VSRFKPLVALFFVLLLTYGADYVMTAYRTPMASDFSISRDMYIWLNRVFLLGFAIIMLWFAWLTLVRREVHVVNYWVSLIVGFLIVFLRPIRYAISSEIGVFEYPTG